MKKRKGQVALEFLMTYGWAFLIILVVIGAFIYFDVLNPGKMVPDACTLPAGLACTDSRVAMNGVTLDIQNNMGSNIQISSANLTYYYGNTLQTVTLTPSVTTVWNGKEVRRFTTTALSTTHFASGDRMIGEIVIAYTKTGSTLGQTAKGSISANIQ